jgi:hypothetical protein
VRRAFASVIILVSACGSSAPSSPDGAPTDADKSATCASSFGTDLVNGFTRFDGRIVAVVPPNDQACAEPNRTHLVIQIAIDGSIYRMVVDVLSNQGSPVVLRDELDAPLPATPWAEGKHTGASLDYPSTLGVHAASFTPVPQAQLVDDITAELALGAPISVFATVEDEPDSAHLVHREGGLHDGAIVVTPDTAPHWILLRFDEQSF